MNVLPFDNRYDREEATESVPDVLLHTPTLKLAILLCCILVGSFWVGAATFGSLVIWAILGIQILWNAVLRRLEQSLCLFLVMIPVLHLIRPMVFFSSLIISTALLIFWCWIGNSAQTLRTLRKCPPLIAIVFFWLLYYVASVVNTGVYSTNLRFLECFGTTFLFLFLAPNTSLRNTVLLGCIIASLSIGLATLPTLQADRGMGRLGNIITEETSVGNPVALGTALALGIIAVTAEGGHWIGLARRSKLRPVLVILLLLLLAMTASRTGWLITAAGLLLLILIDKRQRLRLTLFLVAASIGIAILVQTPFGTPIVSGYHRTFSEQKSLNSKTSGRSEHWSLTYQALMDDSQLLITGYGPGLYANIYDDLTEKEYKRDIALKMQLHSLFLQIAAETGILGFLALVLWMLWIFVRSVRFTRQWQIALPLACFFGYLVLILTVTGNDCISGLFLGASLLAFGNPIDFMELAPETDSEMENADAND